MRRLRGGVSKKSHKDAEECIEYFVWRMEYEQRKKENKIIHRFDRLARGA